MKNKYRVPKRQWGKWDARGKLVFNELFWMMRKNQRTFIHPKDNQRPSELWETVCWNAAWTAAGVVEEE